MKPRSRRWSIGRRASLAAAVALLAACGGGGGGGGDAPTSVALTAANADAASRAAAGSVVAFGSVGGLPLTGGLASAPDVRALAVVPGRAGGWLNRVTTALGGGIVAARKRPLAVIGPVSEACAVSGSVSVTLDDRDDNNDLGIGDQIILAFDACRDDVDTVDGELVITVSDVAASPPSVTADMAVQGLSITAATRTATLDGTLRLVYALPNGNESLERIALAARGDVVLRIDDGSRFSDRLTLQDGWQIVGLYDDTVAVRPGNTLGGRWTTTTSGRIDSAATGGSFLVSTPTPMRAYGEDPFPREGVLLLDGAASALRLTALSVADVRLELDANGDGGWESSRVVAWADLL